MADKPTITLLNWGALIHPDDLIEVPKEKRDTGWFAKERPPYQWMNWLFKSTGDWLNYCVTSIDGMQAVVSQQMTALQAQIQAILDNYLLKSEVVTSPVADKVLRLDANANLPANITGDAQTLNGKNATAFAPAGGDDTVRFKVKDALNNDEAVSLGQANSLYTGAFIPIGSVIPWPIIAIPDGWLECNGQAISRIDYSELFAKISTNYGAGNGSTTYNIPQLQGEYIRGWDNGRGGDAGRIIGSWQAQSIQYHQHRESYGGEAFSQPWGSFPNTWGWCGSGKSDNDQADPYNSPNAYYNNIEQTSAETRTRNVAMMYIIKTKNLCGGDPLVKNADADTLDGFHASAFVFKTDQFSINGSQLFGTPVTIASNTTYQASANGFLRLIAMYNGSNWSGSVYSDSNPNPTTDLADFYLGTGSYVTGNENLYIPVLIPINKGNYYKYTCKASAVFIPLNG